MKLHHTHGTGQNLFTGYGADYVEINNKQYMSNVIVTPNEIRTWDATTFDTLVPAHFEPLLALQPEVVILGTGAVLRFPHPRLTLALTNARMGIEVMDTPAACRTYTILLTEGRRVIAALLFH